jgi:glycosyltransferase involved in cell wall biosynthesis
MREVGPEHEYVLFTNKENHETFSDGDNFRRILCPINASFRPARIVWEQTFLPIQALRHKLDVLLSPGFTSPAVRSCPSVVTIYDLQHVRHPEHFYRSHLIFWNLMVGLSARRAAKVLTLSEHSRRDIIETYGIEASKVIVTPLAADAVFNPHYTREEVEGAKMRHGLSRPYLLCVSTSHPHKNIERLIDAFELLADKGQIPHELVLVGVQGFASERIARRVEASPRRSLIRNLGWVSASDLPLLYAGAEAMVYPSTFEGFGLPVLEAMACGTPVVASKAASLPEVVGDAGLLFDPMDTAEMAAQIRRVIGDSDLRKELRTRGIEHCANFSWNKTARRTLEQLESVA